MVVMLTTLKHLFTPQASNNHRPRLLHPAGLAIILGVFLLYHTWVRMLVASPLPQGVVLGYASSINAAQVISATNAERAKANLSPLQHNATLSQAAAAKAHHMFQNNYWAHIAPDGTTPWVFIRQVGYEYQVAGENLARDFGDTPSMVKAWMDSPTHRDNIMNEKYADIGVAVVDGTLEGVETTLVVQMFGKTNKSLAQTTAKGLTTASTDNGPIPTRSATPQPTSPPVLPATAEPPDISGLQGVTLSQNQSNHSGALWVSPLSLTKSVSLSVILMLIGILLYDEYLVTKHKIPRRVGKNWAHLTLFGIILMVIMVMSEGKISTLAARDKVFWDDTGCAGIECQKQEDTHD